MHRSSILKFLDAFLGAGICRAMTWLGVERSPPLKPEAIRERLRRALFIRPGGMGDMIMLLPVLQRFRRHYPSVALDVLCERRNADLVRLSGLGDEIMIYDDTPLVCLRRLLARRYEVVIDTEQFHHFSAVLARFSRSPVRVGFNINPRRNSLYTHLVAYDPDGWEADQFARLLAPLGVAPEPCDPNGCLEGIELPVLNEWPPPPDPVAWVAVHAGATTPYKRWPVERVVDLIAALGQEGFACVLVGGTQDGRVSRRVEAGARKAGVRVTWQVGGLTLAETAAVIRRAHLFVGPDSGLGHLARALSVPTVILFGPTDPAKWGRPTECHAVVRRPVACAPCAIFGYHKRCRHLSCMRDIGVEDVLAACHQVLTGRPALRRTSDRTGRVGDRSGAKTQKEIHA